MSVRLALVSAYVPGFVKRRKLRELLCRSAEAFGTPVPETAGRSYRECLGTFAAFTAAQADRVGRDGVTAAGVRSRLRAAGREIGGGIRRGLGVGTRGEAMRAARIIYRMLGIDFEGRADGAIVIRSCDFSRVYTARACGLVSGLDEGLLAGLAGEGRLEFASRITEGCERCEAIFHFEEAR